MKLCFDVTKVTILAGDLDYVSVHTTTPSPCPGLSKQPLRFGIHVAAGDGLRYVLEVLRVDRSLVEIIDL